MWYRSILWISEWTRVGSSPEPKQVTSDRIRQNPFASRMGSIFFLLLLQYLYEPSTTPTQSNFDRPISVAAHPKTSQFSISIPPTPYPTATIRNVFISRVLPSLSPCSIPIPSTSSSFPLSRPTFRRCQLPSSSSAATILQLLSTSAATTESSDAAQSIPARWSRRNGFRRITEIVRG